MIFWLGVHEPTWLGREDIAVPLMVSHRRLARRPVARRAVAPWVCDSGGFSEVRERGAEAFAAGPEPYAYAVCRYAAEIGQLVWAAPQDWMCEPFMVAQTGLSVVEHQQRTVKNYCELRTLLPDEIELIPVLQGYEPYEYEQCVKLYQEAGVDLAAAAVVGLGSVCRRQHTGGITGLVKDLAADGFRLHGFGVKTMGLPALSPYLYSSDSMAWSFDARSKAKPLTECSHKSCQNCHRYALAWRSRLLSRRGVC